MAIRPWRAYQEHVAGFFRTLGLTAETDVRLQGVRTTSDVDVLVTQSIAGFEIRWIVECKLWKTPVNQLHVFGLREIVHDLGADRGIILCEKGFQKGAIEASVMTNVELSSLENLKLKAQKDVYLYRISELFDRAVAARKQYWETPKAVRIEHDLRGDYDPSIRNRGQSLEGAIGILGMALRGKFPLTLEPIQAMYLNLPWMSVLDAKALFEYLEPEVVEAEDLLKKALTANPEFKI
ncbi:MAG: restriction endonuclease [Citromicrobium sp.]|nr:restriction endonuclease [Citromicrobium sp.]|tara:strand:+ start:226 stop:936 length:711 start_codon:yes stop_codon:yes gene_type:complete